VLPATLPIIAPAALPPAVPTMAPFCVLFKDEQAIISKLAPKIMM
jgi:hypothetical protein